ncbi:PAB1 binding protein [Scheffersomyces xylosifermentans]|uniref:PAB1 binding protein n=1 Tax=Scheffersomyces xylosifermentans TaxID=1304137 RepID=UPI00315DBC2C
MSSNTNNILKRKNEDLESSSEDQFNKRVALDSEQLEQSLIQEEQFQTAPAIGNGLKETSSSPEAQSDEIVQTPEVSDIQNSENEPEAHNIDASDSYDITNEDDTNQNNASKPVSNHRERESDPTYVSIRMYCPVKEASCIVGKKGEKINHIREKANVRISVSENLKNIPERIISVRGPAENVARAFGLITRTILDEPEDEPASMISQQYNLKILVPHPMIGFVIGKQGLKFREIEENSAAKLKAAEQPLPYSTDRILSITGVGDAIHIAIYYIAQVMIEHKDCLKKNKIVYYNPANFHHTNVSNSMMNISMLPPNNNIMVMGGANPLTMQNMKDNNGPIPYNQSKPQPYGQHQLQNKPPQQQQQPYNFQMMFQPAIHPQQHYGQMAPPAPAPMTMTPQTPYTDEHGNTIIGEVITNPPVQSGPSPDKLNQDIFVANANIGSVIGRGGNNIKHIRENSGCSYVKIEPDKGQSIMLGGGKGLTNIRKLTLTGSVSAIQMAIYLINQRIATDKERNAHH